MRAVRMIAVAALAAGGLWAEGVSGRWSAEVQDVHGDSLAVTMDLKEDDGLLTGSVRGARGEDPISSGTVDGDEISFSVVSEYDGNQIRQRYRGTVEGDVIHFYLTVEDGHSRAAPVRDFEAKRISD